jgi:integrase
MSKQRKNRGSSNSTNQDVFADFEPPNTTDGSYKGTMKHVKATEAHLQRKFEEKLEEVKARLKASKCKVGLKVAGGSIQLQATLPPKPGSDKVKPWQQLISLNIPANLDGLKTAEEEAYALGTLIARKSFEWNEKYLNTKQEEIKIPTIGELLEKFEEEYFKTRPFQEKTQKTIRKYRIARIKRYCDLNSLATSENLISAIHAVKLPGAKEGLLVAIKLLCSVFKIECDFSSIKLNIKRKERKIPSDEEIEESFKLFELRVETRTTNFREDLKDTWKLKRWMYGMLAVYGLRPHELLTQPDIDWWLSSKNIDNTWKVHENCKTGSRQVFPLNSHWIELFDLKNSDRLEELKAQSSQITSNLLNIDYLVQNLAQYLKRVGMKFKPYDLRHAWAIRAHVLGIPIKAAADNLGHSVEMHTSTYQRWFGEENRKIVINEAINKKSETELLKDELSKSKLEIEQLKLENGRLNLELQYAKINN